METLLSYMHFHLFGKLPSIFYLCFVYVFAVYGPTRGSRFKSDSGVLIFRDSESN